MFGMGTGVTLSLEAPETLPSKILLSGCLVDLYVTLKHSSLLTVLEKRKLNKFISTTWLNPSQDFHL